MPCCPCMDNMARSFPFTVGSPLQLRRKWTAKSHQHAYAETHQSAFFYIWPNDIDDRRLVRFRHVASFWIKLNRFQSGCIVYSKCWIFGHMAFHNSASWLETWLLINMTCSRRLFLTSIKAHQIDKQLHFSLMPRESCMHKKTIFEAALLVGCR